MTQTINYNGKRIETGVVKFGDDWTGFYYRGDDCMGLADMLGHILTDKNNKLTLGTYLVLFEIKEQLESAIQKEG